MTEAAYDDDLASADDCAALWQEVLLQAIRDALADSYIPTHDPRIRAHQIQQARNYITVPNKDFNEVCHLAGVDPQAVRERLGPMIAAALSPDELAYRRRTRTASQTEAQRC